ncbi:hypothetical protein FNV43_RR08858 [Rhamnella rubrinervis]|uniref:Uncharacterized protein n=1 Tax=Rhamnella rubrinervis TaxID=2594499 RepID=A0A8K0MJG1_9ROSA|nr:hypothetical protein FNV43_RR08858 [Rhamnella rubrinervis]
MTLTAEEFMYMYHLKKDPKRGRFKTSGWYYASSRKGKNIIAGDHNSNKAEGWKSNLRFKEVSSRLYSRIEFAKNQPTANRSYKNLLRKVDTYFSREALFGEGEKRGNDGSEGSQSKESKSSGLSLPPLTPSSLPSESLTPTGPSSTFTTHISSFSSHVSDSSPAQSGREFGRLRNSRRSVDPRIRSLLKITTPWSKIVLRTPQGPGSTNDDFGLGPPEIGGWKGKFRSGPKLGETGSVNPAKGRRHHKRRRLGAGSGMRGSACGWATIVPWASRVGPCVCVRPHACWATQWTCRLHPCAGCNRWAHGLVDLEAGLRFAC